MERVQRRIVYFIGAGLSKALELPGKPLPLMYDFIRVMADYLADDVILTTLAVLEKEEPSPYDWVDEEARSLAASLVGRYADRNPSNREAFRRVLTRKPRESIEDLLEKAASSESAVRFNYAIRRLFCLVGWDVNFSPLERFLRRQFELEESDHVFVSFNYDLILDCAIQKASAGKWHPSTGYGFAISHSFPNDPPPDKNGAVDIVHALPLPAIPSEQVLILKPHGSLNWHLPVRTPYQHERLGLAFEDGPTLIPLTEAGQIRYCYSTSDFPKISCDGGLPHQIEPCILPPVSAKRLGLPFLEDIRRQELHAITSADEIYVLGWSMPRTDTDQIALIRSCVENRTNNLQRLTVVNKGASPDYFHQIACVFNVTRSRLQVWNDGFCDFASAL